MATHTGRMGGTRQQKAEIKYYATNEAGVEREIFK